MPLMSSEGEEAALANTSSINFGYSHAAAGRID